MSAQLQLRNIGFTVSTLPTSALRFASGNAAFNRLLQGSYGLVWVDTPGSSQSKDEKLVHLFWTSMARWASVCKSQGTPLYICGPRSKLWKDDRARNLQSDGVLLQSTHRFCHFGIRYAPNAEPPSLSTFVLLSSHIMPSHLCRCPTGTKHSRDWLHPSTHTATTRLDAVSALYKSIMATSGFGQAASSGPESCPQRTHIATEAFEPQLALVSGGPAAARIGDVKRLTEAQVNELTAALGVIEWSTQPRP